MIKQVASFKSSLLLKN